MSNEKQIGSTQMKKDLSKPFKLVLKDGVIKSKHLDNGVIQSRHIGDGVIRGSNIAQNTISWVNLNQELQEAVNASVRYRGTKHLVYDLNLPVEAVDTTISTALVTAYPDAHLGDFCFIQIPVSNETPNEIINVRKFAFKHSGWYCDYDFNTIYSIKNAFIISEQDFAIIFNN